MSKLNKRQQEALEQLLAEAQQVRTLQPAYARLASLEAAEMDVRVAFGLFAARPLVEEVQLTLFGMEGGS